MKHAEAEYARYGALDDEQSVFSLSPACEAERRDKFQGERLLSGRREKESYPFHGMEQSRISLLLSRSPHPRPADSIFNTVRARHEKASPYPPPYGLSHLVGDSRG